MDFLNKWNTDKPFAAKVSNGQDAILDFFERDLSFVDILKLITEGDTSRTFQWTTPVSLSS